MSALAGKRAVVTGAGHGIGEAIARHLGAAGARVVAIDRDAARLARAFPDGETIVAAMGEDDPVALADRVLAGGPVELIVNNAAQGSDRTFLGEDPARFAEAMRVNVEGPLFFTKRLVEALIAAGSRGSVLFISSLHDTFVRLYPAYSTGKAGVAMLVKEMAYELAPHGIRVNAISPGWIETAVRDEPRIAEQRAATLVPVGRFGVPDDVARVAVVLLDDAICEYVTGVNLPVDGGLALHNWLMDA